MASQVTRSNPSWQDHEALQSAASAHRRTIAKKTDAEDQLCAALARAVFEEQFSLDAGPAKGPINDSDSNTGKVRVVSILKKPS